MRVQRSHVALVGSRLECTESAAGSVPRGGLIEALAQIFTQLIGPQGGTLPYGYSRTRHF